MPIRVLGFAVAGSSLLVLARDRLRARRLWSGTAVAVVAGACVARLGTFYEPWGLTIGVPAEPKHGCGAEAS